ncbi:hypothetical protein J6590_101176 [Homalodisca vitripennis]|nr:hypothetical protein J6590_101176 [Homalodisca vitripennis]
MSQDGSSDNYSATSTTVKKTSAGYCRRLSVAFNGDPLVLNSVANLDDGLSMRSFSPPIYFNWKRLKQKLFLILFKGDIKELSIPTQRISSGVSFPVARNSCSMSACSNGKEQKHFPYCIPLATATQAFIQAIIVNTIVRVGCTMTIRQSSLTSRSAHEAFARMRTSLNNNYVDP